VTRQTQSQTLPHTFQKQQNGYYCGPASVRVALTCRGIVLTQTQLASELGTTSSGTDSSADVVRVMNAHLGEGTYAVRYLPGPSATAAEVSALRVDLVRSIDGGSALVANVVGPLRTLGNATYTYAGGHYVALVGYRALGDEVLVADVNVGEYWASTAAVATWIARRGYAYDGRTPVRPIEEEEDVMKGIIAQSTNEPQNAIVRAWIDPTLGPVYANIIKSDYIPMWVAQGFVCDGPTTFKVDYLHELGQEFSAAQAAYYRALGGNGGGGGRAGALRVELTGTAVEAG
jgi:hypothetical protein